MLKHLSTVLIIESQALRLSVQSNLTVDERAEIAEMQEKIAESKLALGKSLEDADATLSTFPDFHQRLRNATTMERTMKMVVESLGDEVW
ncbi:hypothetical protein [Streptomyces sp. NPDC021020]|uniref:hypothetical protein n=1 Tax=Streptomyces sp. NPDC021020 TaxID=3365109 RepID=UPI0037BA115F